LHSLLEIDSGDISYFIGGGCGASKGLFVYVVSFFNDPLYNLWLLLNNKQVGLVIKTRYRKEKLI